MIDKDLLQILAGGVHAVEAVRAALRGAASRADAERRIRAFGALVPDRALTSRLQALLDK